MVNLVKIAVGVTTVEELRLRQTEFLKKINDNNFPYFYHKTRMMPKKHEDIISNGSLFWVIKGAICARQKVIYIVKFEYKYCKKKCKIFLAAEIIKTKHVRKRPFQGMEVS